jgi:hypothetical protein
MGNIKIPTLFVNFLYVFLKSKSDSMIAQRTIERAFFGETNLDSCVKLILTALLGELAQEEEMRKIYYF